MTRFKISFKICIFHKTTQTKNCSEIKSEGKTTQVYEGSLFHPIKTLSFLCIFYVEFYEIVSQTISRKNQYLINTNFSVVCKL